MNKSDCQPGMLVQLASGSPVMVVEGFDGNGRARLFYMAGDLVVEQLIYPAALKPASPTPL